MVDKLLPALRSLLASTSLSPSHPINHYQMIFLRDKVNRSPPSLPPKVREIFDSEFSSLIPKDANLTKLNDEYLQIHHESVSHVQVALQVRVYILDPASKEKCSQDMIKTLALKGNLKDATRGLDLLREWKVEKRYIDDYLAAAHVRYPNATAFIEKRVS